MHTALYAAILALWLVHLTANVVKLRVKYKVSFGDGEFEELTKARTAHTNATETIPIFLLLLSFFEVNTRSIFGADYLLHILGISMIIGRFLHHRGITTDQFKLRPLGMRITLWPIALLALLNLVCLPYWGIFPTLD